MVRELVIYRLRLFYREKHTGFQILGGSVVRVVQVALDRGGAGAVLGMRAQPGAKRFIGKVDVFVRTSVLYGGAGAARLYGNVRPVLRDDHLRLYI